VSGTVKVNDLELIEGDGLSYIEESVISINNPNESEIILFDLKG
jgi:redox-sensitive bicupin YhaK (pirin superfamily)